jgi:hypothetical protein
MMHIHDDAGKGIRCSIGSRRLRSSPLQPRRDPPGEVLHRLQLAEGLDHQVEVQFDMVMHEDVPEPGKPGQPVHQLARESPPAS